jgi:hypothetical protein
LIREKKLNARIDSQEKILIARHENKRDSMYKSSLESGKRYITDVTSMLIRMSLVEANIAVEDPNKKMGRRKGASDQIDLDED